MKAIRIHAYGGPEQLELENAPMPELSPDDVLVKVHAAGVNPVDWKVREGMLKDKVPHRLPLILGWDFAGEIVDIGSNVSGWQVGDAVYARPDISRDGSYAEYIAVDAGEIAAKPESLDWRQAAGVPLAGLTAWQCLFDRARLEAGERVLIHAGAGGVGSFAIQLAKQHGAYVYTTASARSTDFVKSLGADEVIDYTREDFSELRDLDVILDTLGGEVQDRCWQTLKRGGRLVSIVRPPEELKEDENEVMAAFWFVEPDSRELAEMAKLFDAGKLKVEIDSVFPLEQAAEAHRKSESGHAHGKIVLDVA